MHVSIAWKRASILHGAALARMKSPLNELYHNLSSSSRVRAQPPLQEAQHPVRFAICKSTFIFLTLATSCCTFRSTTRLKEMAR